jgi:hypothetical protein
MIEVERADEIELNNGVTVMVNQRLSSHPWSYRQGLYRCDGQPMDRQTHGKQSLVSSVIHHAQE